MIGLKDRAYYNEDIYFANIPEQTESIGKAAFSECHNLQSVQMPENLKEIGMSAFYNCRSLRSISIPKQVRTIGRHAFHGCNALEEFAVSEENAWFSGHDGMLFNKSGETLLAVPYGRYGSLTEITVPPGVIRIGKWAFLEFKNLEKVILPEGLEEIQSGAFSECTKLTEVTFPESLRSLGGSAFYDCNIKKISIPDSVTSIGEYVFSRNIYDSLEYRGVIIHSIKQEGVFGEYHSCEDIDSIFRLIDSGNFSVSLKDETKYSIISQILGKEKYHEFFRRHIGSVIQFLIDNNRPEEVQKLIHAGDFLNADNIDEIIRCAIEKESYDIQLMLTEYKRKYIGYRDITEVLKL